MTAVVKEQFKVATFNIANAGRDEKYEYSRFAIRKAGILETVQSSLADVVCMQELRTLETSQWNITSFLALFDYYEHDIQYDHSYGYYSHQPFAHGVLFNRKRLSCVQSHYINLEPVTPYSARNPYRAYAVLLESKRDTRIKFWVISVHFPMGEQEKDVAIDKIMETYIDKSGPFADKPVIVLGDFNFFDDLQGTQQRERMLGTFPDHAHPLSNASGTFLGFAHDSFKREHDNMTRLDHIFASSAVKKVGEARVEGNLDQIRTRTYPSDHMMVSVEVEVEVEVAVDAVDAVDAAA